MLLYCHKYPVLLVLFFSSSLPPAFCAKTCFSKTARIFQSFYLLEFDDVVYVKRLRAILVKVGGGAGKLLEAETEGRHASEVVRTIVYQIYS